MTRVPQLPGVSVFAIVVLVYDIVATQNYNVVKL